MSTPLLLLLLLIIQPAPGASEEAPENRARPVYHADKRLDRPITLGPKEADIPHAVAVLAQETGVNVLVQESGKGKFVQLPFNTPPYRELTMDRRPARELMDAMAVVLMGSWRKAGDVYVLTDFRDVDLYLRLSGQEREARARRATDRLFGELTPAERAELRAGKDLEARKFPARQQRNFFEVARYWWSRNPRAISPNAVDLLGCALRLTPDGKSVGIFLPVLDEEKQVPAVLVAQRKLR